MSELTALSATELLMLYRRKAVSPIEVVEAVLARITVREPRCSPRSGAKRLGAAWLWLVLDMRFGMG